MDRRTFLAGAGASVVLPSFAAAGPTARVVGSLDRAQPFNRRHPLTRGLLSWWVVLPELRRGRIWRDLVATRAGTLQNLSFPATATSGWSSTGRVGGEGELRFDGTDDLVSVENPALYDFANTTFLLCGWARASVAGYLMCRRNLGAGSGGYFARLDSGGTLTARILNNTGGTAAQRSTTTTALVSGAWFHWAVGFQTDTATLANNDVTLYINGELDQGSHIDDGGLPYTVPSTAVPLTFGTTVDVAAGTILAGAVDDCRVYQPLLRASTVQALYRQSRLGNPDLLQTLPQPLARSAARPRVRSRLY